MGAFEGSLTFKTFYVDGEPPNDFADEYLRRIEKLAFKELTPASEEERSLGWVVLADPLSVDFSRPLTFLGSYVALGLRIDKWSIPGALLKAHFNAKVRAHLIESEVERLSKRQRDEIKDEVVFDLKRRLVPSMKVVDMVWNIHSRTVRFWTHSETLCEEFQEFFEETFDLQLTPESPYTTAVEIGLEEDALNRMVQATPDWFYDLLRPINEAVSD